MGTPYTQNDSRSSGLGDTKGSTRKRTFDSLDESHDESQWDFTEDGRPKTRRVNPLRLAIRLGPELVAEMEALIVPGAKMPTFSVRKDFQERYCVDRRHIYDYFHSRGLRVAKEDKHTNLIRGRAMKAEAQSQAASKLPSPTVKRETEAVLQRPFPAKVAPSASARGRGRSSRQSKTQGLEKGPCLPCPSAAISSKRAKKSQSIIVPDIAEMLPGGVSSESGIEASSSGTDTDSESSCPKFTLTTDLSDDLPEKSIISDFLQSSPDTFGSGYFSSPMETSMFLDLETGANLDMLMTAEEHRLLTQDERTELYNLIDNSMHQAHGFGESSGFYMKESYFDPLLPIDRQVTPAKLGVQGIKMSESTYDPEPSMDYLDIRRWLSEEIDLSEVGPDTYERHAFRNEFDLNLGFSDILSSLDAGTYATINEPAAHLPMQNQYYLEKSIDNDPMKSENPNAVKKSTHNEENVEPNNAQRHNFSSLASGYGRVRTTSARGGI